MNRKQRCSPSGDKECVELNYQTGKGRRPDRPGFEFLKTPGEAMRTGVASPKIRIAIFALPKSFEDPHIDCIQRNAIESWKAISDCVEVILIGDEIGLAEAADELQVRHVVEVDRNQFGTPLISHAFHIAKQTTDANVLVYCNADVILFREFFNAIECLVPTLQSEGFLAIGRRTNLDVTDRIHFSDPLAVAQLKRRALVDGVKSSIVCKEFFAYWRDSLSDVPDFAVGRGNWDNWMVANAKRRGVPVVDVSDSVLAIHQNHDYHHLDLKQSSIEGEQADRCREIGVIRGDGIARGLRRSCYVSGEEALANEALAGGKNIVSGSTGTHRLTDGEVLKDRWAWACLGFWLDLPRFLHLVKQLVLK